MIDLWEEKHWEYQRQPMVAKDWQIFIDKINVAFLCLMRFHAFESNVKTKSPR
jgi:hypothetical protein